MADSDNDIYGFTRDDALLILQRSEAQPSGKASRNYPGYIAKTPVGGIAARSGDTVSSADCTIYTIRGSTLTSLGFALKIFNLSSGAVAGEEYIQAKWAGGVLVADFEDCGG